jgi:hypothetical protein
MRQPDSSFFWCRIYQIKCLTFCSLQTKLPHNQPWRCFLILVNWQHFVGARFVHVTSQICWTGEWRQRIRKGYGFCKSRTILTNIVSNLRTLRYRSYHFDALFLIHICLGSKFCRSVLETDGLWVPAPCSRDFSMFSVCLSSKNFPSARSASATNVVCRDLDVFGTKAISLNHIL